jgi:hypothetical protein
MAKSPPRPVACRDRLLFCTVLSLVRSISYLLTDSTAAPLHSPGTFRGNVRMETLGRIFEQGKAATGHTAMPDIDGTCGL